MDLTVGEWVTLAVTVMLFLIGQAVVVWVAMTGWGKRQHEKLIESIENLRADMSAHVEKLYIRVREVEHESSEQIQTCAEKMRYELSQKADKADLERMLDSVDQLRNTVIDVLGR